PLTGWRVGWACAAAPIAEAIAKAHQFLTFTTPPNLQRAVAYGLGKDDAYFRGLAADLQRKGAYLSAGLRGLGCEVLPAAGTYFVCADLMSIGCHDKDEDFCRKLTTDVG